MSEQPVSCVALTDAPSRRRKGCGCWTIVFLVFVGTTLFVFGTYGFWRWSNARGVERMIALAREKGEPTTPEEMAEFHATSPEIDRTTRLWLEAMTLAEPAGLTSEDRQEVAYVGYGRKDDPASFEEMRRCEREGNLTPAIYAASKAYLPKVERAIELAHEARRSGTLARFPLEYEYGSPTSVSERRELANVLALDLAVRRKEGATDGLLDDHLSLLAFSESSRAEPGDICQWTRLALLGMARSQLLLSLEREELSADDLAELQRAWEAVDFSHTLRLTLLDGQMSAVHDLPDGLRNSLERDWRPCPEEDAFRAATMLRSIIDASGDLDAADAALASAKAELDRAMQEPLARYRFTGWARMLDSIEDYPFTVRRQWTWVDATIVVLAFERFRLERGDWPAKLEDLVPVYLESLPRDRYDGGSIKYRREPSGVVVYALGEDRTDDEGILDLHVDVTPNDVGVRLSLIPDVAEGPGVE